MVNMEPFTYKLFPTFFALLDDMSVLFSQIESNTSTDRVWAAQIESDMVMHRACSVSFSKSLYPDNLVLAQPM